MTYVLLQGQWWTDIFTSQKFIFSKQCTTNLGTSLTNQNSIQEEIKSRLKSGNACYHSVQNLLSSSMLSKNFKIKIHRTIILPVVLKITEEGEKKKRRKKERKKEKRCQTNSKINTLNYT